MALLLDEDYDILRDSGLEYSEDEEKKFLIIKNFPLKKGFYEYDNKTLSEVEILVKIPNNYNTAGNNMFWTFPVLKRSDGKPIPRGGELGCKYVINYEGKEFCRWSRHYATNSWKAKVDNVQKILDRVEWSLKNPDSNK